MPSNIDDMFIGAKHDPALAAGPDMMHELGPEAHAVELPPVYDGKATMQAEYLASPDFPTFEELKTLRRVSDKVPIRVYAIAFVELCERFSYYGTTVVFTDFIQQPRPDSSLTGAGINDPNQVSGALGMGQRASTGIGTFNQFWVYVVPLFGAYVADTYLGRYNTIAISIAIAIVGHVILTASAAPMVLNNTHGALAAFLIGLIIMGLGTGGFKPNISPLVAEQVVTESMRVKTLPSGERVIVDPAVTTSRVYNWFYLFINIGALVGQITMAFSELYVGFWLAYLLPTMVFLLCPLVMVVFKKQYKLRPPQGSVLGPAMRLFFRAQRGRWSLNPYTTHKRMHDGTFWENVKPSKIPAAERPKWMTFDDAWVDEVRRGFKACAVFLYFPVYWLCYNQLNNNLISQAAVMQRNGLPPEIASNLDPFALIILIPICDLAIYPLLRRWGIMPSPIKKIFLGFMTATAGMIWAAVVQAYIYQTSPCGFSASDPTCDVAPLNVWIQSGAYILVAISEIMASITSLEYAFSKAPKNMRSLVMSFSLFMTAFAAALGEAFVPLSGDPLLVWNYGVFAVLSFAAGVCFFFNFRGLDREEDSLNNLPTGHMGTSPQAEEVERRLSVAHTEKI